MKKLSSLFKESFLELRYLSTIAITGLFIALAVILGLYSIQIGDFIKITFSFIAIALTGCVFGPAVAGIMGGITDIVNFIIKPTGPFFPGFTFNAILNGIICGLVLYKKPITLKRTFIAKMLVSLFINLFLSTLWLNIMYGKAFIPLLGTRFIKELVMLPIEVSLLFSIMKSLEKAHVFQAVFRDNN